MIYKACDNLYRRARSSLRVRLVNVSTLFPHKEHSALTIINIFFYLCLLFMILHFDRLAIQTFQKPENTDNIILFLTE